MSKIMNILKEYIKRLFGRPTPQLMLTELRKKGAYIGEDVNIHGYVNIDKGCPFMLHIGTHVEITDKVTILTHDYSWSVIKGLNGHVLGGVSPTYIGDNVFIGNGAIILMGSKIGNNTIIAAGSVVSGTYPDNVVIAGVPGRVVCTLDEYYKKRKSRQYEEAVNMVKCYRNSFNCTPKKEALPAYFFLFEGRNGTLNKVFTSRMHLRGNFEESMQIFKSTKPMFNSYEDFLDSIE